MEDPSKSLNKLIELLDDIPNGIVKEEIEECIRRIQLRLEGDASLKETSKLVYDALVEERYFHTPPVGENTRINRDTLYPFIKNSQKEASFISSSSLALITLSLSESGIQLKTKTDSLFIPDDCKDPKERIHSFISQSIQQSPSFTSSFDADRIPGMGIDGGSLMGPECFRRNDYYGDDRTPVNPFCIPPGARFDPFRPGPPKPTFPAGVIPLRKPTNPSFPPFSSPNPDHLPPPGFHDLY